MSNEENAFLSTELTLGAETGDRATINNLPASVLQALYREFTGRTESMNRVFDDNIVVEQNDIIQLVNRLTQFLGQYQTKIIDVQFSAKHLNGGAQNYSSLFQFERLDQSYSEKTVGLELVFSFLISTPDVGVYQNYRVIVNLYSYYLKSDFQNLTYGRSGPERIAAELRIEYVDYVVASSIVSLFENWLSTLERSIATKKNNLFIINNEYVHDAISLILVSCASTICFSATYLVGENFSTSQILRWQAAGGFLILFSYYLGKYTYSIYENKFWSFGTHPFIVLNKADRRNLEVFKEKRAQKQKNYEVMCWQYLGE